MEQDAIDALLDWLIKDADNEISKLQWTTSDYQSFKVKLDKEFLLLDRRELVWDGPSRISIRIQAEEYSSVYHLYLLVMRKMFANPITGLLVQLKNL